jgi:hypothetical protein
MKTLKFFLLIFIISSFFSCSKSDDDNSCSGDFLECYDGTIWTYENSQNTIYRFSNNLNSPIEKWDTCLPNFEGYTYYDGTNFELIENSKRKLIVTEQIFGDTENTWTFETDGNQLTLQMSPAVWGGIGHLIETSIDVYNLQGCN